MKFNLAWILAAVIAAVATEAAPAQTIVVGDLGILADAPFYIGIEKGYFAKVGLTLSLQRFTSAAQATLPLSTDQLQVVGGGMSAGLFNAFARGLPIRIGMARTREGDGFSTDALSLRADLRGTVTKLADLKGRKIAINAPAGALEFMLGKMLESVGLTMKDADVSYMSWPDMGVAFTNRSIDAGTLVEPFTTQYAERKLAFPLANASDVITNPPFEVSVVLLSKNWIDRSPDQVRGFAIAYVEAVRDYYAAMRGGPTRPAIIDIVSKYTVLKDKALYNRITWSYMDPNAEVSVAGLKDQEDWYASQGEIEHPVNVDAMIDRRFLDQALAKLGRVAAK